MESKDWIELIIPIVSNGILVYLLQSYFNRRLEKKQGKATQITAIVQEYQKYAESISRLMQNFAYSLEEAEQNTILTDIYAIATKELFPYFDRHSAILNDFKEINSATLECANKLRDALTTQNRQLAVKHLDEFNGYMQKISNECDQYILHNC